MQRAIRIGLSAFCAAAALAAAPALGQTPQIDAITAQAREFEARKDWAGADPLLRERAKLVAAASGAESTEYGRALTGIASNLEQLREYVAAEPFWRDAATISDKVFGLNTDGSSGAWRRLANNLYIQARYADSAAIYERVLKDFDTRHGTDHEYAIETRIRLGNSLQMLKRFDEAGKLYQQNLEIARRVNGPTHAETGQKLLDLARNDWRAGRLTEAATSFEAGVKILRADAGFDRARLIPILTDWAMLLRINERRDEARLVVGEALTLQRQLTGDNHPATVRALMAVGTDNWATQAAVDAFSEAVKIARSLPGERELLANALQQLAISNENVGKRDEGLANLDEALRIRRQSAESPRDIAWTAFILAEATYRAGRYADAAKLFAEAVPAMKAEPQIEASSRAQAMRDWRAALMASGQPAAAITVARDLLAEHVAATGETSPAAAYARLGLAQSLSQAGKPAEAEPEYGKVVAQLRAHPEWAAEIKAQPEWDQGMLVSALFGWSAALSANGRKPEAAAAAKDMVVESRRHYGEENVATAQMMATAASYLAAEPAEAMRLLGEVDRLIAAHPEYGVDYTLDLRRRQMGSLSALQRYDEAAEAGKHAVALAKKERGETSWETADALISRGSALWSAGRMAEAEPVFAEGVKVRRSVPGQSPVLLINDLGNWSTLLDRLGRNAEAIDIAKEALKQQQTVSGAGHPDTMWQLNRTAQLMVSGGRSADAEDLYKQTVSIARANGRGGDPVALAAVSGLAQVAIGRRAYDEAERLYRDLAANGGIAEKVAAARGMVDVGYARPGDGAYVRAVKAGGDLCLQPTTPASETCIGLLLDDGDANGEEAAQRALQEAALARKMAQSLTSALLDYHNARANEVEAGAYLALGRDNLARERALAAYTWFNAQPREQRPNAIGAIDLLAQLAIKEGAARAAELVRLGEQETELAEISDDDQSRMDGAGYIVIGNILLRNGEKASAALLRMHALGVANGGEMAQRAQIVIDQSLRDLARFDPAAERAVRRAIASGAPLPAAPVAAQASAENPDAARTAGVIALIDALTSGDGETAARVARENPALRAELETSIPQFKALFLTLDLGVQQDAQPDSNVFADPVFWSIRDELQRFTATENAETSISGALGRSPVEIWIVTAYEKSRAN